MIFEKVLSSSHQHTSGKPAFLASSSRLHRFQDAALAGARGEVQVVAEVRSHLKKHSGEVGVHAAVRAAAETTVGGELERLVARPVAARLIHPYRLIVVCTNHSKISVGCCIVVFGEPSSFRGIIACRTEDTTLYALKASDWMYTTTM